MLFFAFTRIKRFRKDIVVAAIENFEDGRMSLSVTFLDADFLDAIDQGSCASHLKTSQETRVEAAMLP